MTPTLPLTRLRLTVTAQSPMRLPDYAGSVLRGAFGHALRKVACITRAKDCAPCALKAGCPYTAVFAPGKAAPTAEGRTGIDIPAPYVIEAPEFGARALAAGERFAFHQRLFGRAIEHLPIIVLAWQHALAKGLGPGDGQGTLDSIHDTHSGEPVFDTANGRIHPSAVTPIAVSPAPTFADGTVTLHFVTPLRLQKDGRALPPQRVSPRALILACARRASLLMQHHGSGPPAIDWHQLAEDADAMTDERQLHWRDWTRYSSRQKQKMDLGGVIGTWTLHGPLTHAMPWLQLGEQLNIGKETVFGLGQYTLKPTPAGHKSATHAKVCEYPAQAIERKEEIA